tara:strand:+ start:472 stop:627 length:156 start_codon:yes stop_codon:yes gene_type:complete
MKFERGDAIAKFAKPRMNIVSATSANEALRGFYYKRSIAGCRFEEPGIEKF